MNVRVATNRDIPALRELIDLSARELSRAHYSPEQIDSAARHIFGVDTQLIADATYFVVDGPSGPIAAGGWSRRRTLYGGDQFKQEQDPLLDPAGEPARIRAFFVHPSWTRRGLATAIYDACERSARAMGFRTFELMATLPGEPLYRKLGFEVVERVTVHVDDTPIPFARMMRQIEPRDEP
jgi:N-acetylglutamate synthase-like GNAT family acetyltransferase